MNIRVLNCIKYLEIFWAKCLKNLFYRFFKTIKIVSYYMDYMD